MDGGMGWGQRLALGALALGLGAPAWAGNPDGKGFVQLGVSGLTAPPSEAGNEQGTLTSGRLYHEYVSLDQDWTGSLYAALPLNRWSSLDLETEFTQMSVSSGRNDPLNSNYYDEAAKTQIRNDYITGRFYLAALFGHDWNPDLDHPLGVLGWPVLWVEGHWYQGDTQYSYPDNVGFTITGTPADLQQESADLSVGVVLPLDPQTELEASVLRNVLGLAQQGGASSSALGGFDVWRVGASHDIVWENQDPSDFYFPRQGRFGRLRVAVDGFTERSLANDGNLEAGMNVNLSAPIGGPYAAALGWNWTHLDSQGYDSRPDFTASQRNQDEQFVNVKISYAFADAALSASPAIQSPAAQTADPAENTGPSGAPIQR